MNFSDLNNFSEFRKYCLSIKKCTKKCFLFKACGKISKHNFYTKPYFETKFELLKVYFRKQKLKKLLK